MSALVRAAVALALAGGVLAGCSGGPPARAGDGTAPPPGPPPAEVRVVNDLEAARAALGQRVRIDGTAHNAKISAVVVAGDLVVYCLDRAGWPDDVAGTQVSVIGTLEWTEEFIARRSPNGEYSTGTDGGLFAIRSCAPASAAPR